MLNSAQEHLGFRPSLFLGDKPVTTLAQIPLGADVRCERAPITPSSSPAPSPGSRKRASPDSADAPTGAMVADGKIEIRLVGPGSDDEVKFKVKLTTKAERVFLAWHKQSGRPCESYSDRIRVRFLLDGERIAVNDWSKTLGELDLEDGDVVDCFLEQEGGGSCFLWRAGRAVVGPRAAPAGEGWGTRRGPARVAVRGPGTGVGGCVRVKYSRLEIQSKRPSASEARWRNMVGGPAERLPLGPSLHFVAVS